MAFLVAMFAVQTFLVYSDNTGRDLPPLSDAALEGRALWLSHNCQACHQLYDWFADEPWRIMLEEKHPENCGCEICPMIRLTEGR